VYAVIEDGGRQFRVCEGDVLNVDLRDAWEDVTEVEFGRVLLLSGEGKVKVGTPMVKGAKVVAEVVEAVAKGPKLYVQHWRPRKASRRKAGHRQKFTKVRITKIKARG